MKKGLFPRLEVGKFFSYLVKNIQGLRASYFEEFRQEQIFTTTIIY